MKNLTNLKRIFTISTNYFTVYILFIGTIIFGACSKGGSVNNMINNQNSVNDKFPEAECDDNNNDNITKIPDLNNQELKTKNETLIQLKNQIEEECNNDDNNDNTTKISDLSEDKLKTENETLMQLRNTIVTTTQKKLSEFLLLNNENNIEYKTKQHLENEFYTNCTYKDNNDADYIYSKCIQVQRIKVLLNACKYLIDNELWGKVAISGIFTFKNYKISQINDDFVHIQTHLNDNKELEATLHFKFINEFKCGNDDKHIGNRRENSKIYSEYTKNIDLEENVFYQVIDKIRSYLLQLQKFRLPYKAQLGIIKLNDNPKTNVKKGKSYIGKKEDDDWWDSVIVDNKTDEEIYIKLIKNIGIFKWQQEHGFRPNQYLGLMHLKPKFKNYKDEIFNNPYHNLSTDAWNQTKRKANVFLNSISGGFFATIRAGRYYDIMSNTWTTWEKKEFITERELIALKLYTDFDKLQYELKKCFRYITLKDVHVLKNFNQYSSATITQIYQDDKQIRFELKERYRSFFWWIKDLLTMLNKFSGNRKTNGSPVEGKLPVLYHGINAKMILNYPVLQNLRFYGPLSTTESYHVARTFGTAKGMTLQVANQYSNLGDDRYGIAFKASFFSDYPEEKEWLLAFSYLRIIKVFTRPLNNSWFTFDDIELKKNYNNIPLSSKTRAEFFAVHLFLNQILSMSITLEYYLSKYLSLLYNFDDKDKDNENDILKKTEFDKLKLLHKNEYNENEDDYKREDRILSILSKRFYKFVEHPNKKQLFKFDEISGNLKPYFMYCKREDINKNKVYGISIKKVIQIFKNIKEIQYWNNYILDDIALKGLVQYLEKNEQYKLQKVTFLYYDYKKNQQNINSNCKEKYYPIDSTMFFDPDKLDKYWINRLSDTNWKLKHKNIGNTGYRIVLSKRKVLA